MRALWLVLQSAIFGASVLLVSAGLLFGEVEAVAPFILTLLLSVGFTTSGLIEMRRDARNQERTERLLREECDTWQSITHLWVDVAQGEREEAEVIAETNRRLADLGLGWSWSRTGKEERH